MAAEIYQPSPIKRHRVTNAEMVDRREALHAIVKEQQPMTVRQVFYQATVRGLIEKTEHGYRKIQQTLVDMRRDGSLPYGWITDNTRAGVRLRAYDSIQDALEATAEFYRRRLWSEADCYVEIWLEKDALTGVIKNTVLNYDVQLMVARGYASLSFLHSAAEDILYYEKPTWIYHFGDFDPSGVNAAETIERELRKFAHGVEIHFQRVAVTPQQIIDWKLPTRPTKLTDTRAKSWTGGESVELDAIRPDDLRQLVRGVIEQHIDYEQLRILQVAEASERKMLCQFAASFEEDEVDEDDSE